MKQMLTGYREWKAPRAAVPRNSDHGAMYYFAIFSRILTPLALIGWLCWMPLSRSDIPQGWDPECPELTGTWVECDLESNKQDVVTARLWYLDAHRLLQIEHAVRFSSSGNAANESRIAMLDPANGSRIQQTSWMPDQAHYWPGSGLASTYHDATAKSYRLVRWNLERLTEERILTLPEDNWKDGISNNGSEGLLFRPAPNAEWQLIGRDQPTPGLNLIRGLQLDANGDFKSIAWEPEINFDLYPNLDSFQEPFTVSVLRDNRNMVTLPNDPVTGWPDVRDLTTIPAPIDWRRAPRFGHIPVPLTDWDYSMEADDSSQRVQSLLTAPLGVTDAPFPSGNLLLQASYLAGQLRTQVWRRLYKTPYLEFGMVSTLRLEEVRLIDAERGINCVIDANTRLALQRQGWCMWSTYDSMDPGTDPRLPLADGANLQLPLQTVPLPGNRLLVVHSIQDSSPEAVVISGRIRLGLVDQNQLTWLGWVEGAAASPDPFGGQSVLRFARVGDHLLMARAGTRWNGPDGYATPSTWIALPLPPQLADLPEGPLE